VLAAAASAQALAQPPAAPVVPQYAHYAQLAQYAQYAQADQVGVPEPARPSITLPYDTAIAAYRGGRVDESLAIVERALQSDPRNPQLRFLRGVILTEKRRSDDAIEVFRALIEDFPELPEPYNNLAVIHAGRGAWDAARAALEQSIRTVPTYALAHENLGDIHLQLAARAYEEAGRLDPASTSARSKLSMARELIGRVQAPPVDPRNPRPSAQPQVTPR
jgi:tetratricopeptide (TPR) repeat protein